MMETVDRILELCRTIRCQTATERELQDALEVLLRENFSSVTREAQLGPKDIVDFLVDDAVAVEVKVDQSPMAVTRQLQRYAAHEKVQSLVLVTTRAKHKSVQRSLRKKPVRVAWLAPF